MKKNSKKFIVHVSITFSEGKYIVEFMRCRLNRDGFLNKPARAKFNRYTFTHNHPSHSRMFFMLFRNDSIFQRPNTHFNQDPTVNACTRFQYDEKRIAQYLNEGVENVNISA